MSPRILPQALWTLHWLSFRARLRKVGRGCRSVRGALGLLAGLAIFGFWLASFFIQRSHSPPHPRVVRDYAPIGLLVMCLLSLVFSKSGQGIGFRPAEVEFLFPGPFHRRELLLHRIVGNSLVLLPSALMFSLFVYPHVNFWLAGFVGTYLALQFFTLVQIAVSLFAGSVRERLFSRARLGVAILVVVVLALSLLTTVAAPVADFGGRIAQLREWWPATIVLFPFDMFGKTLAAASASELIVWGSVAAAIDMLLVGLVLWLDVDYREAALKTSQRIHERLQSARRGRLHWTGGTVNVKRLPYIGLPWLRGAGPVASYQMTLALRSAKGLVPFLVIMLVSAGLPMFLIGRSTAEDVLQPAAIPALMFLLIVFPQFLQFDFRGDVDRMDLLKTLPLRPVAVACGQLLAPAAFLLVIEGFCIGLIAAPGVLPASLLVTVVAFLPLANVMVFAVENLIWLLYPYRIAVAGAADFQAIVRQTLLMLLKMLALGFVFGAAAGVGTIAWLITKSTLVGVIGAWFAGALICGGLVPLVAWAFERFDPAADSPA